MTALAYETYYLGLRTTRRFLRVPANYISVIFFPLIQLLIFSQLYQDIIRLPGFGGQSSYLAYLAPGQVVFAAFMAVAWSGFGLLVEYRNGASFDGPVVATDVSLTSMLRLFGSTPASLRGVHCTELLGAAATDRLIAAAGGASAAPTELVVEREPGLMTACSTPSPG